MSVCRRKPDGGIYVYCKAFTRAAALFFLVILAGVLPARASAIVFVDTPKANATVPSSFVVGGWATGTLPLGSGENEIAKFLGEAMGLAKQMQAAMASGQPGGDAAKVQILIADPEAGAARQSAIDVSVASSGQTAVTLHSGGGGHLVAMLQHFLLALNPAPRA